MEQQDKATNGVEPAPAVNPNAIPDLTAQPDFTNSLNPDALPSFLPGQPFIPDPSLGGIPMADSSLMMPIILANGHAPPALQQSNGISADDIALYDRQIRLWGMAAQAKIQSANILLITIRALATEAAKNLVLAGVGSLTILDGSAVTEADLGSQFFLSQEDVGKNRAEAASIALQKLNPRVNVHVDAEGVKLKGPSYFAGYDIVIATDLDPDSYNLINTATRLNGKAFYAAGTHGMYGFIFSDLIEHDYVIERDVGNVATEPKQETRTRAIVDVKTKQDGTKSKESVTKRELYSTWFLASDLAGLPEDYTKSRRRLRTVSPALSCLRALWEFQQLQGGRLPSNHDDLRLFTQIATKKHKALGLPSETLRPEFLRSFLQNLGSEVSPVAAILGGQLAQDVINVLGQNQQPIQNMIIFDGSTMESLMYPLHPEGVLGANLLSSFPGADGQMDLTNGGLLLDTMNGVPNMGEIGVDYTGMGTNGIQVPVFPTNGSVFNGLPAPDQALLSNGETNYSNGQYTSLPAASSSSTEQQQQQSAAAPQPPTETNGS